MKVLQIGMGWFPEQAGGLNRYFFDLLHHLPGAGIEVEGLVAGSSHDAPASVEAFSELQAPLPFRLLNARQALARALKQSSVKVVASHFALHLWPGLDLIRGRPLVVHFHGPWSAESRVEGGGSLAALLKHRIESSVYRRGAKLVVLSQAFGDLLVRDYGVRPERIRLIPGGVDLERFRPACSRAEARRQLGWDPDRPLVLAVRRLVRRMGLEDLIDGIPEARQRVEEVNVLIAGRGPLAGELASRIRQRNLERHVRLIGHLPDRLLPLAYRAADVTIVPSTAFEGFGLIVVESLASGTPVIVTRVGGLPEIVSPLSPECIVPAGSPGALGATIAAALDGAVRLPSETECRQHVEARYDWRRVATDVAAVYAEALG